MPLLRWASPLVAALVCTAGSFFISAQVIAEPLITRGAGDACVADTDFMRRNHMDLIIHQRDDTVIRGLREEPFSLVECVNCHAHPGSDGSYLRIDSEGQFCASCHTYTAVKIDCFSCHAAVPAPGEGLVTGALGGDDTALKLPHTAMLNSALLQSSSVAMPGTTMPGTAMPGDFANRPANMRTPESDSSASFSSKNILRQPTYGQQGMTSKSMALTGHARQ